MSGIQKMVSAVAGTRGYKCVEGKGHLDNCNDPRGVCETNSICKFVDEIKRRGKLDKKIVSYLESNNIENGINSKNGIELVFSLNYDNESGNRVTLDLLSPTVYEFDIHKYKYNKILQLLDETLMNYVDDQNQYDIQNPFQAYNLISQIVYNNKKKFKKLRRALAIKMETILPNSIYEYTKLILKNGTQSNIEQTLTIENINKDDIYANVKNYIDNIKKSLRREYASRTRHIFPPLSKQFTADIKKPNPIYEIKMPNMYDGGNKPKKSKKCKKYKSKNKRSNKKSNKRSNKKSKKTKYTRKCNNSKCRNRNCRNSKHYKKRLTKRYTRNKK